MEEENTGKAAILILWPRPRQDERLSMVLESMLKVTGTMFPKVAVARNKTMVDMKSGIQARVIVLIVHGTTEMLHEWYDEIVPRIGSIIISHEWFADT